MKFERKMQSYRFSGMEYALKVVKESGVEALERLVEAKRAGILPISLPAEHERQMYHMLTERIYETFLCAALYSLHEEFGFGEKRLKRLRSKMDDVANDLNAYDRFGERYVQFQDIGKELHDKYGIVVKQGILEDVDRGNNRDQVVDRKVSLEAVRELLEKNGFKDAVKFLEEWEVKYYAS